MLWKEVKKEEYVCVWKEGLRTNFNCTYIFHIKLLILLQNKTDPVNLMSPNPEMYFDAQLTFLPTLDLRNLIDKTLDLKTTE